MESDESWETLLRALDAGGHLAVREELLKAAATSTLSSEVLGEIGQVMKRNQAVRGGLDLDGRAAWDDVARAVNRVWRGLVP